MINAFVWVIIIACVIACPFVLGFIRWYGPDTQFAMTQFERLGFDMGILMNNFGVEMCVALIPAIELVNKAFASMAQVLAQFSELEQ